VNNLVGGSRRIAYPTRSA